MVSRLPAVGAAERAVELEQRARRAGQRVDVEHAGAAEPGAQRRAPARAARRGRRGRARAAVEERLRLAAPAPRRGAPPRRVRQRPQDQHEPTANTAGRIPHHTPPSFRGHPTAAHPTSVRRVSDRRLAVIDLGSNSFRLVVFTWGEHGGHGWWRRTDEIHEAVRVGAGPRRRGRAAAGADGARARDDRAVRPLLPRHRHRRRAPGRHLGDPRRDQPGGVPEVGAQTARDSRSRCSRRRRRPATATSRRSTRRRSPTASRSTSAAARCSSPTSRTARRWTCARGRSAPCA